MTKAEYRHILQPLTQGNRYEADVLSENVITDFTDFSKEADPLYERRQKRKYIYCLLQERRNAV